MPTTRVQIPHPAAGEYAEWYDGYVAMVAQSDIMQLLEEQPNRITVRVGGLDEARALHRYAEGKWSVKDVVNHMTDAERVFSYRLLRVARGDARPLQGFDENAFAMDARADERAMEALLEEFVAARESTLALVRSLRPEVWTRTGTANGAPVSARSLAAVIAGHVEHHLKVLAERYGI
ncbi:MAG TPA: DinB family protein [Gemmatimonadaceae bacterium]